MDPDLERELRRAAHDDRWALTAPPQLMDRVAGTKRRRRRVRAAAAGVAGAGVLAGVSLAVLAYGPGSTPQRLSAQASATASSPNSNAPGACTPQDLHLSVASLDTAAGTTTATLQLTNVTATTCTLHGYPSVGVREAQGDVPLHLTHGASGTPVEDVTLAPGASAAFRLGVNQMMVACKPRPGTLRVTPPGAATAASLTLDGWGLCPGADVELFPIESASPSPTP